MQGDAAYDEAREKARLARGALLWKLDAAWKVRSWQANRALRDLNAAVYDARTRETASSRAREGRTGTQRRARRARERRSSPRRGARRARGCRASRPRGGISPTSRSSELEAQRQRLDEYSVQARYALATIYDRATASPPPATPQGTP